MDNLQKNHRLAVREKHIITTKSRYHKLSLTHTPDDWLCDDLWLLLNDDRSVSRLWRVTRGLLLLLLVGWRVATTARRTLLIRHNIQPIS